MSGKAPTKPNIKNWADEDDEERDVSIVIDLTPY
jgi:hypothetical protein